MVDAQVQFARPRAANPAFPDGHCGESICQLAGSQQMPPIRLSELREYDAMRTDENEELTHLLALKKVSSESGGVGRYPALDKYIAAMIPVARVWAEQAPHQAPDLEALNDYFKQVVFG